MPTIEEDESDSVNSGESPSVKESTPSSLSDQVGGEDRSVKISRMVSNIKKIHERVKVLLKEEFFGVSRSGPDNASDSSSGLINDVYIGKIGKGWAAEKVEKSVKGGEAEVYLTNSLAIRWKNDQKTEMTTEEFNANVRKEEKILSFLGRHKKGSLVQVFDVGKGKLIDEAIPCSVIVNKRYESDCSKPISSKGEALKKDIQKMAKCMINELSVLMSHGVYPTDLRLANMSYHPGSEELLQLEDLGGSPMDSELNEKPKGIMYSPILGSDCDKALNQCTTKEGRIEVLTKAVLFLAGRALFDLAYVNSTEEKKKKIKASQAQTIPQDVLKGILEVFYDDLQSVFILDLIKSPEKYKILHLQSVFGLF